MNLNTKVQWYYCLIAMIPLTIAIFQILDYYTYKALGISAILVFVCFSMFFFLRRDYFFTYKTVISFYAVGFIGSFLMAFFKQDWLVLPIVLSFWILLLKTISYTSIGKINKLKIQQEEQNTNFFKSLFISPTRKEENKKILIDIFIVLSTFLSLIFFYTTLINIFK
ncbi:hypothetical protein ACH5BF_00830 [Arcobacter sp. YIC-464]|uniref:hypothetical protein n=1 Tax=Arcobacter sp. YIC-464 TaxID=3376631 RepID=UPI003C16234B